MKIGSNGESDFSVSNTSKAYFEHEADQVEDSGKTTSFNCNLLENTGIMQGGPNEEE